MYAPYRRGKSAYRAGPCTDASATCIAARHPMPATIVGVAGRDPLRVIPIAMSAAANAAAPNRAAIPAGAAAWTSWRNTTQKEPVADDPNARSPKRTRSSLYRRGPVRIRSRRSEGALAGEPDHEETEDEQGGVHGDAEGTSGDRHLRDSEGDGARRELDREGREGDGEEPPPPSGRRRRAGREPSRQEEHHREHRREGGLHVEPGGRIRGCAFHD